MPGSKLRLVGEILNRVTLGACLLSHPALRQHTHTPSPLLIATGESIPLLCVEGVPRLPGAPQDDAGLTRKFEMSLKNLPAMQETVVRFLGREDPLEKGQADRKSVV